MPSDMRPFAIVVNTAPDEFLFGANGDPVFAIDSGPERSLSPQRTKGAMRTENDRWPQNQWL